MLAPLLAPGAASGFYGQSYYKDLAWENFTAGRTMAYPCSPQRCFGDSSPAGRVTASKMEFFSLPLDPRDIDKCIHIKET